jgi:hypothetical protein
MRKVLPLAVMLAVAGCGTPMHWEKQGADPEMLKADMTDCRRAASQEAFHQYAFDTGFTRFGAPYWGYAARPSYGAWRSRLDSDRSYAESRLTNFCMRNKGYELVPNEPPQAAPADTIPAQPQPQPPPRS